MKNLNQSWMILIIFGILFLIFTFVWEFLQITSGADSEIDTNTNPLPSATLFSPQLEEHLSDDLVEEQQ